MEMGYGLAEGKSCTNIKDGFPRKTAILLDFVQMRGEGGPAQIFWHLFISAFLVNKMNLFPPK